MWALGSADNRLSLLDLLIKICTVRNHGVLPDGGKARRIIATELHRMRK
jgi:hypothetical protein